MNFGLVRQELLDELRLAVHSLEFWEAEWEVLHTHPDKKDELFEAISKIQMDKVRVENIAREITEESDE